MTEVSTMARKRRHKGRSRPQGKGWKWTLTNIGAVMSMTGLLLAVGIAFNALLTGFLFTWFIFPIAFLIIVGYALIVKDYLDNRERIRSVAGKRRTDEEE